MKLREIYHLGCLLENDDAFLEGLKSDDCRSILVNYFQNIQEKIEDFYIMVRKNNKKEIKCENHLYDLSNSVKFIFFKI